MRGRVVGLLLAIPAYAFFWVPFILSYEPSPANALLLMLPGVTLLVWAVALIEQVLHGDVH